MHRLFSVLHIGSTEISETDSRYLKNRKNLEKGVDNWESIWYSNKAVAEVRSLAELLKRSWKTSKKAVDKQRRICYPNKVAAEQNGSRVENFWKKFLTNEMKFAIIAMFRRMRRVPCKLNNVTKRKHQTEAILRNRNQEVASGRLSQLLPKVTIKMKLWQIAL